MVLIATALFTLGNMSLEELMHLSMNHPALPKLVKLNGQVTGLPRKLTLKLAGHFPCHTCQDTNCTRNDFPPATGNHADNPDLWSWDLFNMGEGMPYLTRTDTVRC